MDRCWMSGLLAVVALCGAPAAIAAPADLDASFGAGGKTLVNFGGYDEPHAVVLQPDGKIVLAGYSDAAGTNDFAIARLTAAGAPDALFGGPTGRVLVNFGTGSSDIGADAAVQPDGMLVVGGASTAQGGTRDFGVARVRTDGTLDPGFGGGGPHRVNLGSYEDAESLALLPDGKIIMAGSTDNTGELTFAVARLLPTGLLDASGEFSGWVSGWSLPNFDGGTEEGHAVAVQPDGKIVAVGDHLGNFGVSRIMPSGFYDNAFGSPQGRVLIDFGGPIPPRLSSSSRMAGSSSPAAPRTRR